MINRFLNVEGFSPGIKYSSYKVKKEQKFHGKIQQPQFPSLESNIYRLIGRPWKPNLPNSRWAILKIVFFAEFLKSDKSWILPSLESLSVHFGLAIPLPLIDPDIGYATTT